MRSNRARITHPDGKFFEYAYEPNDNLMFISENGTTELISNFFDPFARRERIERNGSGSITAVLFDEISRLRSIGHNLDGDATTHDLGIGFSYNPASQVVARAQTNSTYDYPIGVVNQTYTSNGRNQYTQIAGTGGGTPSWDLNGNLTSDGQPTPTNYAYDTENRLTAVSGAKTATLTYDPMGRLYQVSNASGTTRFLYDGDRLIAEYSSSGVVQRRYVHGANVDEPMVWYEGSSVSAATRRYLHADHLGSIIATTNAAGTKLDIGTYDAYGVTTAPSTWRFQYTGQTAIQQVGLYYYKARFYNPGLGRFKQTDPIGYKDDLNLYSYVGNDPLDKTDPSGNYGCGEGFSKDQCAKFNKAQAYAARRLEKAAARLSYAVTAGGKEFAKAAKAFEKQFGKGTGTAENMSKAAGQMTSMASALRDDGSGGHWATGMSGHAFAAAGHSEGAMAFAPVGGTSMSVNLDHPLFDQTRVLGWAAGHEAGHNIGLVHPPVGGVVPYAMGNSAQRALFGQLSSLDPAAAMANPDEVMRYSYGYVPQ